MSGAMSVKGDDANDQIEKKNVTTRLTVDMVDDLDREIKRKQLEGELPMNVSRSEVIRRLIEAATENPEIMVEAFE